MYIFIIIIGYNFVKIGIYIFHCFHTFTYSYDIVCFVVASYLILVTIELSDLCIYCIRIVYCYRVIFSIII